MSQQSYGNSPAQQKQKNRKVSILFARAGPEQHSAGINKVVVGNTGQLFTASRDATIKRWQANTSATTFAASLESHCDWVNDLALVEDVLFSCSADKTIKLWQTNVPEPQQECSQTLLQHSDYVTALAAAPDVAALASAGLRGEAFIWDVLTAGQGGGRGPQQVALGKRKAGNTPGSVYTLAMNAAGTVLAAGTAQSVIRIADARTGGKIMKLRGHTGNVRSVLLDAEGRICISGAADRTIRVWDLGQQRCLHTLALHTDSVWTLAIDPHFSTLLSGGRDGCVYRTQLATRLSELLLQEPTPIQSLAPDPISNSLWVATASSSLHRWQLDAPPKPTSTSPPSTQARQFVAAPSALLRSRQSFGPTGAACPEAQQGQPVQEVAGVPPLVRCASLLDRRHILAQDATGHVELWDIASGSVVKRFGQVDFGQTQAELFLPESVSAWFALDCKLGSLMLGLEPPACFGADVYGFDLGILDPEDDQRFNYGEHLLRAAFLYWSTRYNLQAAEKSKSMDVVQQAAGAAARFISPRASPTGSVADGTASLASTPGASPDKISPDGSPSPARPPEEVAAEEQEALAKARDALLFKLPHFPAPIVISSQEVPARPAPTARQGFAGQQPQGPGSQALPWRLPLPQFTGQEPLGTFLPLWAAQAVSGGGYTKPPDSKCAFLLRPGEGGLPAMLDARLTAPKVLRMTKVASYTQSKLQEQGIALSLLSVPLPPQGSIPTDKPILELTCNGQAIPDNLTLAAIKTFVWKRSDDLVFVYRIRNAMYPAPIAQIGPAS